MRCVVGKVEKEGLFAVGTVLDVFDGPIGEQVRSVTLGMNLRRVEAHIIVAVAKMAEVVVHHIAEEPLEMMEPPVTGVAVSVEPEVPLPDQRSVVFSALEDGGEEDGRGVEIAPVVLGVGSDDAGYPDAIGIAARHQRGTAG